jgi:hypothetical protein
MRCFKLIRFSSFEYGRYEVYAEILDGSLKGREVDIGWMVKGDHSEMGKGTLHVIPEFLEIVE